MSIVSITKKKYVFSLLRHAISAVGVYAAAQGVPEAWIAPALAYAWSVLDKYNQY